MCGPPKTGKTTTMLSFAANCQLPQYGGRRIHYMNVERRLKRKNLLGIRGLDLHPDRFLIYESTKQRVLSAQDHLEIAIHVLKTDPECVVLLDSVSALVEQAVLEEGLGTQTRGGGAKLVTQFIDIVSSVVPVQGSIVLGVTHLIADTSGRSVGLVEKAANRWLYQADVRLRLNWAESWVVGASKDKNGKSVGGREIGKIAHWTCQESALGPPGIKCSSRIRYGVGVDRAYELMEMGVAARLIAKDGAWYEFSFLPDMAKPPKAQGMEKAYALIQANPGWCSLLQDGVAKFLAGGPADEGDGD